MKVANLIWYVSGKKISKQDTILIKNDWQPMIPNANKGSRTLGNNYNMLGRVIFYTCIKSILVISQKDRGIGSL